MTNTTHTDDTMITVFSVGGDSSQRPATLAELAALAFLAGGGTLNIYNGRTNLVRGYVNRRVANRLADSGLASGSYFSIRAAS